MNFKTVMFYLIFFISTFQIIFAQNISTATPTSDISTDGWETRFVKHLNNQAVWISKIKDEYNHREYIQLAPGQTPILFYEHQRGIHPILGHLNRYILVNDEPAHDASEVHIIDLNNGKNWRIDGNVIDQYSHLMAENDDRSVLPYAEDFSPNDKQVLITMRLGCCYREEIPNPPNCVYVVDSISGKILKEYNRYKSDPIPTRWWVGQN